jgi:hypothetical protein
MRWHRAHMSHSGPAGSTLRGKARARDAPHAAAREQIACCDILECSRQRWQLGRAGELGPSAADAGLVLSDTPRADEHECRLMAVRMKEVLSGATSTAATLDLALKRQRVFR